MTDADKDKLRRFLHMDLVAQYVNARLHIDDEAAPDTATHHNTVTLLKLTGTPVSLPILYINGNDSCHLDACVPYSSNQMRS